MGLLNEEDIINYTKFLSSTIDDFRNFFRNDKESSHFLVDESIEKSFITSNAIIIVKEKIELFNLQNEFIQVVLNILKNAIDAFSNNHKKYILIKAYEENNLFVLSITDTAEHIIGKIFEPYFTSITGIVYDK